jgi:outer membrane protein assembly factor BamB
MKPLRLLLLPLCLALAAADWPQFRGPDRSNVAPETGLLKSWPAGGPKLLWTFDQAGVGYAGPAIVGDRLYTMGAFKDQEYLFVLDVRTGTRKLWQAPLGPLYSNNRGSGPRGTPTVADGLVYALGGRGGLVCVAATDGKEVWRRNLVRDLGGQVPMWGYSESPLVDGDRVVCTPGGARGTLAALDRKTGKALWRSTGWTDRAEYPSVVVGSAGGVRQYVQMTAQSVAGVAPADGKLLWRYERPQRITIPTPICFGDYVYVTSGYRAGCNLLKVTASGGKLEVDEVYANSNMVNHHGGVVLYEGHVYGFSDGRGWVCQDFKSGKIVWQERRKLGKGSLTCADGLLFLYSENNGTVVLIDASPKGWNEKGRFTIPQHSRRPRPALARQNIWTHPVVANGRLYLRDQEMLFCYDVRQMTR